MASDLISEDFDLSFENGDISFGESSQQHARDILIANPGDFKAAPWLGVAIQAKLKSPNTPGIQDALNKEIRLQLESDNAKVGAINTNDITNIELSVRYD